MVRHGVGLKLILSDSDVACDRRNMEADDGQRFCRHNTGKTWFNRVCDDWCCIIIPLFQNSAEEVLI